MKLFGKELFSFRKEAGQMYDFAQHGLISNNDTMQFVTVSATESVAVPQRKKKKEPEKIQITPKGIYEMKALNDNQFVIKADLEYIEQQIADAETKLDFIGKASKADRGQPNVIGIGAVVYGRMELESIIERLKNRKRLDEFKEILEEYPHTISDLINDVIHNNSNLRCQRAEEFVPDFPRNAISAMKKYDQMCIKLCNKKAVYYVVATTKDFEKKNRRRDPILLAQSPFGFFWQILGAWDEEMVYLGDL